MITPEQQNRLAEVSRIAVRLEQETAVPANLLVAQWALESKWGEKPVGNANYFGIKKADRHTKCCTATTQEVAHGKRTKLDLQFADYDSLEESCRDYAWLLSNGAPYRKAWQAYLADRDARKLLLGIAGTYATDPLYHKLVQQIAGSSAVIMALTQARM
jgi:flagellum-specific peptidoglycan hydrolase FlgJ